MSSFAASTAAHTPSLPAAATGTEWRAEVGGIDVLFGLGAAAAVGELARELGGRRALVVTDPGVRAAGHADRAAAALGAAGVAARIFDAVIENPTTREVAAGRDVAASWGADLVVGLGGGSAMDCAKGINFLLTNGGRMEDYRGFGHARLPLLPAIGLPTTAGTGSEAQSYALIAQAESHQKMACGDRQARFRIVVLDPSLLASAPRRAAAAAGLDALAHAVESLVCRAANPVSRMLSREAWRLLEPSLLRHLAVPAEAGAAGGMLLGAHLAGAAIELSMLGAAHACANPLSARHGVAHGVAVALMLPHVVRWNGAPAGDWPPEDGPAQNGPAREPPPAAAYAQLAGCASSEMLAARLEELRAAAGLPERLREVGVEAPALRELAREAAQQWTAGFNPRPAGEEALLDLYEQAF
ncbi:MAG TPA: iron-containing alcohol dehydrogenase [Thermoanaerobaculia bacterium]